MKSLFLILLIVGIILIGTMADGADWILLGESNIGTSYYDRASIKRFSGDVVRVSVKYAYSSEGAEKFREAFLKTNRSEMVGYTLYIYDINCSSGSFRLTKAITYNSAESVIMGTELQFSEAEQSTPEHITPNSMMEQLSKVSCR
ncbi:MAG: surface-adhesin E family protein [Thermodesulfovibrionales bacterium]